MTPSISLVPGPVSADGRAALDASVVAKVVGRPEPGDQDT